MVRRGCLIIFSTLGAFVIFITGYIILFPEKPASEKTIKKILKDEFNQIENTTGLNRKIEVLCFLEKNKPLILSVLKDDLDKSEIFLNLNKSSTRKPNLPTKLFDELSNISSSNRIDYQLKITENGNFSLTKTTIDHKNYLYITHDISRIDTSAIYVEVGKYSKTILIKGDFQYKIRVEDAFDDIDPNNFTPN
ncbi:MAG: hypothetical protein AAGD88_15980 [Bacteroidota bacterium]